MSSAVGGMASWACASRVAARNPTPNDLKGQLRHAPVPQCPALCLVRFVEEEMSRVTGVVKREEEGNPIHPEMLRHREGCGRFHVDRSEPLAVPVLNLPPPLCEQSCGREEPTDVHSDVRRALGKG